MASKVGRPAGAWRYAACVLAAVTASASVPTVARAQFFWEQPRLSADDAARVAIQHGYRVTARPFRNDDVYVAEVIDRRGERERLIIAAETGQILQRIMTDPRRNYRTFADPSIPPGPIPPARIPNEERRPGFFARLFGGDDGRTDQPAVVPSDRPLITPDQPVRQPRVRRQSRTADQAPEFGRPASVESAPLAPPTAAPRVSAPRPVLSRPAPVEANLPATAAPAPTPAAPAAVTPPADKPGRSISRDPLAIPGSREQDEKVTAGAAAIRKAAAAPPAASATPAPDTKPAAPTQPAVPVAPLE